MDGSREKIIIKGMTRSGHRFRPSDWAQRLATAVSRLGPDRRIRFHPKVTMALVEGVSSVVVEPSLEEEEPMLFRFLMGFAEDNDLQIVRGA